MWRMLMLKYTFKSLCLCGLVSIINYVTFLLCVDVLMWDDVSKVVNHLFLMCACTLINYVIIRLC